jgi:hypothetical protein
MTSNVEYVSPSSHSKLNIAWVLGGDRNTASSRLQGYLIHEQFLRIDVSSSLIASNFNHCKSTISHQFLTTAVEIFRGQYTHVIFEGPEWISTQLAMLVRARGIVCICVRCDRYQFDYDRYFDLTILPTETLCEELKIQRAKVIRDMVEVPIEKYKRSYSQIESGRIKVAWLGHQNYGPFIFNFIESLKINATIKSKFSFETISIGPSFTRQWREESVVDDILACDLVIIPIPEGEWFKTKSANRLTMMFALGMPCVATPISSYQSIGSHDENVIFAASLDEFKKSLVKLIDQNIRERVGINARQSLAIEFSPVEVAREWFAAIQDSERQKAEKIKLSLWCFSLLLSIGSQFIRRRY